MKTRAVLVNWDPGNVGELSMGYQLTGLEIAQVIQDPNRERQTEQATGQRSTYRSCARCDFELALFMHVVSGRKLGKPRQHSKIIRF